MQCCCTACSLCSKTSVAHIAHQSNLCRPDLWTSSANSIPPAGAIIQMTRCAALDSAKHGIRVNAVCPGPILTEGTARHAALLGVTLEEACAEMTSHQILPRCGRLQDGD